MSESDERYQRYLDYLESPKWRAKRQRVLSRDDHECQTCLETEQLEVHHKTYDNLFHEPLDDLITLCRWCHEAVTSCIRGRFKYGKRIPWITDVVRSTPSAIR